MPLFIHTCNTLHCETSRRKGSIDFLPYLKVFLRDTRSYNRLELLRVSTIQLCHPAKRVLNDTFHRTPPACMGCTDGMMNRIVKEDRDTVGRMNTDADVTTIGDDSVFAFFLIGLFRSRKPEKTIGHGQAMRFVYLMKTDYLTSLNTYLRRNSLQVVSHSSGIITAIRIDVQCCKPPFTDTPMARRTECHSVIGNRIIMQYGLSHPYIQSHQGLPPRPVRQSQLPQHRRHQHLQLPARRRNASYPYPDAQVCLLR